MDTDIIERIRRIYAAIDLVEERDPNKLKATIIHTDKINAVFQDFRGGFSDDKLLIYAHALIQNIANLKDHLKKWATHNGQDQSKVENTIDGSMDLQIINDLSNYEKHGGYIPREVGRSGKSPRLVGFNRIMRLQPQAKKGSSIAMTLGADGVSQFFGDGTAKSVVTADVVDKDSNRIGDLYDIANNAIKAWEKLLVDFGVYTLP